MQGSIYMIELLFRGKRFDGWDKDKKAYCIDRGWVEGSSVDYNHDHKCSSIGAVDVQTSTISQYTGITDSNGKKIFGGDIVNYVKCDGKLYTGLVRWYEQGAGFEIYRNRVRDCSLATLMRIEVIGNAHDNFELLRASYE